jgi:hypothetical protein
MTWGLVAVAGATLIGGIASSDASGRAADKAAKAQTSASDQNVAEAQRQFDATRELLKPYNTAGTSALTGQQDLLGQNGADAQQKAINGLASSPQMQAMQQQGENAMLQNASATGGLRGGNLQAAMAQFRPQLLNQMIQQQYGNLGGMVSVGQNAAAGVGNAGANSSNQIINAQQQAGAAQAGAALANGQAQSGMWNNLASTGSMLGTMKLMGKF